MARGSDGASPQIERIRTLEFLRQQLAANNIEVKLVLTTTRTVGLRPLTVCLTHGTNVAEQGEQI